MNWAFRRNIKQFFVAFYFLFFFVISTLQTSTQGPGYTKLAMSLVNVSLIFQTLLFQIQQYFLLKKCDKLLHYCFIVVNQLTN